MTKKEVGRPTKYNLSMGEKAIELMAEGASKIEVAVGLGISRETLYDYCNKYPEFSDAIKKGESLSEGWWTRQGRINLHNRDFNTGLWFINMKNRFGWRDKIESNHSISFNHEKAINDLA